MKEIINILKQIYNSSKNEKKETFGALTATLKIISIDIIKGTEYININNISDNEVFDFLYIKNQKTNKKLTLKANTIKNIKEENGKLIITLNDGKRKQLCIQ